MQKKFLRNAGHGIGLACVAGTTWYIGAPKAEAAIISSPFNVSPGSATVSAGAPYSLDIDGDGTPDTVISVHNGEYAEVEPLSTGTGTGALHEITADGNGIKLYNPGDTVSYSGSFLTSLNAYITGKKFISVMFKPSSSKSGSVLGSFALAYNPDAKAPYTISDVFYENTPANLTVTAVPEPTSLGALAIGAAGMLGLRRKRSA